MAAMPSPASAPVMVQGGVTCGRYRRVARRQLAQAGPEHLAAHVVGAVRAEGDPRDQVPWCWRPLTMSPPTWWRSVSRMGAVATMIQRLPTR